METAHKRLSLPGVFFGYWASRSYQKLRGYTKNYEAFRFFVHKISREVHYLKDTKNYENNNFEGENYEAMVQSIGYSIVCIEATTVVL